MVNWTLIYIINAGVGEKGIAGYSVKQKQENIYLH